MVNMHTLDKKLLRDFKRLWAQALAISLVLACGVAILVMSFGMYRALNETRNTYYERNRFADVFASMIRAPERLLSEITAIPGVYAVEARTSANAILDIPGRDASGVGKILSLPANGLPQLNVPVLRSGDWPDPMSSTDVLVNEPFAQANGLWPGDVFFANLNGQKRALRISGTVLSPEFIYTIGPGALMPDNEGYGIIWMPKRAAAAAFDMTGAFNDVSLKLSPNTRSEEVIDQLDRLLEPYGGLGAFDRSRHGSDAFVDAEITQLRGMSLILPPIFFGISAFLVSMVMGRIVALERSEIGLLKAIGYSDLEICLHYLMLAGLVALCGIFIGWAAGLWLALAVAGQYAQFFNFPYLLFQMSYWVFAMSGLAALFATTLGAARSALAAAALAPAIAMQPPAPPRFKRSIVDIGLTALHLSQSVTMILRSVFRWPLRSALTTLGLAFAVASIVAAFFLNDALDSIVDSAFNQSNRQDATLLFSQDVPVSALEEVRRLPGVLQAEGQQYHAAVLKNGALSKTVSIEARTPDADLSRVVNDKGRALNVPPGGILLSDRLAQLLQVQAGDLIEVAFLTGRREAFDLTVSGTVTQYFGIGAYMDLTYANQLFRQAPRISVANISIDASEDSAFQTAIKDIPKLAGTIMMNDTRRAFHDTIRENVVITNTIYITIAVLITVGVAYNGARILLSERARELASLRILGFSSGEVSFIFIGESLLLALLAQPVGWLLGAWISSAMAQGFSSDLYTIPLVLNPSIFALSSLVVLAAALASVLIVRRRLDRLDLIAVMKTRE